jgi:hypothetical protein
MYTLFIHLFLKNEADIYQPIVSMVTGYLKLTNVQNVHHQPQSIADNNMQQSGILLARLLVE